MAMKYWFIPSDIRKLAMALLFLMSGPVFCQFAPPAGQPGSSAIHRDSTAIIAWAETCSVIRGYVNISDTLFTYNGSNKATYGNPSNGVGKANDLVVSLGDGGEALLTFSQPVVNGTGYDFAVFENAFSSGFLELAFVEVSSDGLYFVRFPSSSLTPTSLQVGTFDTLDAKKIHNLAGKYQAMFGTPFDLQDISDSLRVDINHIAYIRIVDVVGVVQPPYACFDASGNIINDPWPTPFDTGGFDLDAIGVLHNASQGADNQEQIIHARIFPNPVKEKMTFIPGAAIPCQVMITDINGCLVYQGKWIGQSTLDFSSFPSGMYLSRFFFENGSTFIRKIVKL